MIPSAQPPLTFLPVFNAQPGATLLLSADGVIVGASDDYLAATLTQRDTLVGQYIFDAFPDNPETPQANAVANVRASLEQVLATQQLHEMAPQHYDVPDPARPGRFVERHWQPRHTPVLDAQGQVQFIIQSVRDITASALAERQLHESQAREQAARTEVEGQRASLERLFMQAPAAICILSGPELVFEFVNPLHQRMFPGRELLGRPLHEAMPDLAAHEGGRKLRRVYETGVPNEEPEIMVPMRRVEGGPLEEIYFHSVQQPRYNAHGQIDGVLLFTYDITEQVRARQQVEQLNQELETRVRERTHALEVAQANTERQRRRLSEVFEQAPVAICVFAGPDYVLEVVNPPMAEMLGQPAAQLVRQPFFEALPELTDQGLRELLDQVRQTGRPVYAQEQNIHLARHGVGGSGYYSFTYQPLRDTGGQVSAVTCVATDVTEQVRARQQVQALNEELAAINEEMTATNEELHESNTQLLRTNADLDTFVYAASHDLKAPITNIEGLLDALREYLPPQEQEPMVPRLVGMIEGAIQRFQQTIAHLADVTRLQHGSEPVLDDVDVPGILEDVRLDVLPLLESTQTQLRLEVSACPGVRIPVKHLRSILFNLLSNAVKYRAPDRAPVVQVRAQCTAGRFVLEVQDNGLGLSETQQGYLFTMFKRLHTHVEGSGVGLYLIKRMIDLAGGTIAVASQPGLGSTFTVTLPCA